MLELEVCEPTAIFVVVVKEVLVARDIQMIVQELRPDAHVLLAPTLREAADALPPGRIEVVFAQTDGAAVAKSGLSPRVVADKARVVLVGEEEAPGLPEGWSALPFPFFGESIASLLSGVSRK